MKVKQMKCKIPEMRVKISLFVPEQPWNNSIIALHKTCISWKLHSPAITSSLKPLKGTALWSRRHVTKIKLKSAKTLKFTIASAEFSFTIWQLHVKLAVRDHVKVKMSERFLQRTINSEGDLFIFQWSVRLGNFCLLTELFQNQCLFSKKECCCNAPITSLAFEIVY